MTTREAAPFDSDDERPSKRHRAVQAEEEDTVSVNSVLSLDSVNDDCLLLIFSFMDNSDGLNSLAVCGQLYRETRNAS